MNDSNIIRAMYNTQTAMEWERAKGKLRAIVAAIGSVHSGECDDEGRYRYQVVEEIFDAFIKDVEDNEYHLMPPP